MDSLHKPITRRRTGLALGTLWYALCAAITGFSGCGTAAVSNPTTVHDVNISQDVTPRLLTVQPGDEIRWHNLLPSPVKVGILDNKWQDNILCQKGFMWFGQMNDLVTIAPNEYVSLCFSKPGTVRYNVWLDPNNLTGSMTPTSTIRID